MVGENTKTGQMVGENTNETTAAQRELAFVETVSDSTKKRSPLLPVRHQRDFFVCDIVDAAVKGDSASMEHPIFSLSKKPDMKTRRYENGQNWAEIRPSTKGMSTVFDRDILIYCISQLIAAMNDGRPISQKLHLRAYDLLVATNRDTSGRGYVLLQDALERLQGTQLVTNIVTGGKATKKTFSPIKESTTVRETDGSRMQEVEIELSDWVFQAVEAHEVLTLDRRYFQLAKPLERRLYELARKHVGQQASFKIGLDKLRIKCGSQSTLKEFRRLLQTIIADDLKHNHMPGYCVALEGDMVEMRPKQWAEPPALPSLALRLSDTSYELARTYAPGWDVYGLEGEWRDWIAKKDITPANADAHFLAFCKRRGKYPGFR